MDTERMQDYCAAKPGAWPDWPWEHTGLPVFMVGPGARGKIFAFLLEAVDVSYQLVVEGLPRKLRPDGWDTA